MWGCHASGCALYAQTVRLLLERWQRQRGIVLEGALERLLHDERHLRQIMERLGFEAHRVQAAQGGEGDLTRGELLTLLDEPELLGARRCAHGIFWTTWTSARGSWWGRGAQGSARHTYRFPHRTFQEYLAGCHLVRGRARERVAAYWERAGEGDFWQVGRPARGGRAVPRARGGKGRAGPGLRAVPAAQACQRAGLAGHAVGRADGGASRGRGGATRRRTTLRGPGLSAAGERATGARAG